MSAVAPQQPVRQRQPSERGSPAEKRHFAFLHRLECVVTGKTYPIEVAHLRYACAMFGKPMPGISAKSHHSWTLPLHVTLHRTGPDAQHNMSEREFWAGRGFDPDDEDLSPLRLCLELHKHSLAGDVDAALAAIREHRWRVRTAA